MKLAPFARQEIREAVGLYRDLADQQRALTARIREQRQLVARCEAMLGAAQAVLDDRRLPYKGYSAASIEEARREVAEAEQSVEDARAQLGRMVERESGLAGHVAAAHRVAANIMNELDLAETMLREELDWPTAGANPPRRIPGVA